MAKAKVCKKLPPWASENQNCKEDRFVGLGNSFMLGVGRNLKGNELKLYACMMLEWGGKSNGKFSHSQAQKYGFASSDTFDRARDGLIQKGMIERINDEERSQFKTAEYKFTHWKWRTKSPP